MAFIVMITKSSYGLHHLLPTLRSLRTTRAVLTDREAFCFLSVVFPCFGVLCMLPISLFHLVSVFLFSWSYLRDEEEEEEEEPITEPNSEEEREDDAQCQGKDRY